MLNSLKIDSEFLNQERNIFVWIPERFKNESLPVLYLLDGGICRDLEFYSSIGPDHSGLCNWDSGTGSRI